MLKDMVHHFPPYHPPLPSISSTTSLHIIHHSPSIPSTTPPPYQNESEKNTHSHTCPCDDWTEDGSKPGDAAVGPADESSHYKNKGRKVQVLPG